MSLDLEQRWVADLIFEWDSDWVFYLIFELLNELVFVLRQLGEEPGRVQGSPLGLGIVLLYHLVLEFDLIPFV